MSFLAACSVAWTADATTGALQCSGTLSQVDASTLLTAFNLSQLDPTVIAQAFGAGFVLVGTFSIVGIVGAAIIKSIRGNYS